MISRAFLLLLLSAMAAHAEKAVLRVGYFPNITHAQGVIGSQTTRVGHGWFEQRLGPDVTIQWFAFNAGPSAMEAIFAGSIDLTYVGPNPALNAYIRSRGDEIRVLAGAAEGGAALVVAGDGRIKTPADFRGRKLATPQFGNTQDVAARAWLKKQGFKITQTGGDVFILPTANPTSSRFSRPAGSTPSGPSNRGCRGSSRRRAAGSSWSSPTSSRRCSCPASAC